MGQRKPREPTITVGVKQASLERTDEMGASVGTCRSAELRLPAVTSASRPRVRDTDHVRKLQLVIESTLTTQGPCGFANMPSSAVRSTVNRYHAGESWYVSTYAFSKKKLMACYQPPPKSSWRSKATTSLDSITASIRSEFQPTLTNAHRVRH